MPESQVENVLIVDLNWKPYIYKAHALGAILTLSLALSP